MNKNVYLCLLALIGYVNGMSAGQKKCPFLSGLILINNVHQNNDEITLQASNVACKFTVTKNILDSLKESPLNSPATALNYHDTSKTYTGIIINQEQLRKLCSMSTSAENTIANGPYVTFNPNHITSNYHLGMVNFFSPLELWNKTDTQNLDSKNQITVEELDKQFLAARSSTTSQSCISELQKTLDQCMTKEDFSSSMKPIVQKIKQLQRPHDEIFRSGFLKGSTAGIILGIIIGILIHKFYAAQ